MKVLSDRKRNFYAALCAALVLAAPASATTISSIASKQPPRAAKGGGSFDKDSFAKNVGESLSGGDMAGALALFDSLPAGAAEDAGLSMLHASLLLSSGDAKSASAIAKKLYAQSPKDLDVLSLNMMVAKASGDNASKSRFIKQILAIDPNNVDANVELGGEQVMKHNYKLANTYYRKAYDSDKNNLEVLFGLGQTDYYMGNISEGRACFNTMLKIQPDNPTAYYYLGKLSAEDNKYRQAAEYVEKAIAIDDANTDFYLDYGTYLRFMGKFEDAEKAWTRAIELDKNYFLAYAYRGGLYDEQDMFEKALADYRMVIKTNPKYYFAYESLGIIAWHEEQWAESRAAFMKARELNDDNISYPLMIAATYFKEGNRIEAKKFLAGVLKTLSGKKSTAKDPAEKDRYSIEYDVARMFHDLGNEQAVAQKVRKISNSNRRGKLLYYMGLYCELIGGKLAAPDFYSDVVSMKGPMFFEYRLAEWSMKA